MATCSRCGHEITATGDDRALLNVLKWAIGVDGVCKPCAVNDATIRQRVNEWRTTTQKKLETKPAARPARAATVTIKQSDWWKTALDYWGHRCAYCGKQNGLFYWTRIIAEHWIPVCDPDCPGSGPDNILPACATCNMNKNGKEPRAWVMYRFGPRKGKEIIHRINTYFAHVKSQE